MSKVGTMLLIVGALTAIRSILARLGRGMIPDEDAENFPAAQDAPWAVAGPWVAAVLIGLGLAILVGGSR